MTATNTIATPLESKKEWNGQHAGIYFRVSLHGEGRDHTPEGRGSWCYYLTVREHEHPAIFPSLWLEDKIHRFSPESQPRVSHDYYDVPVLWSAEMHGGITFYQKHGHTVGLRAVEIGCDYCHIWDIESYFRDLDEVVADCKRSCELLAAALAEAKAGITA